MKKIEDQAGGYAPPRVEFLELRVEKGFAASVDGLQVPDVEDGGLF